MILPHYLKQANIKTMAQVIECLREYCEIDFMLELIEAGLNSGNLDKRDVEEILRDTFLDNDDYRKRVLDMMVAYFIDIPIEIRKKIWEPKIVLQNFVSKYCYKNLDNRYLVSFWFLI